MAQCHVALVWGGDDDPAPEWTEREIDVARLGFRRPIPIVAIVPAEGTGSALVAREADRTVPMSATSIGLAIQELAAAASAAKRSAALERDEHDGTEASTVPAARSRAAALGTDRELPVTEIVLAYEQLRAGRNGRGTGAGSV